MPALYFELPINLRASQPDIVPMITLVAARDLSEPLRGADPSLKPRIAAISRAVSMPRIGQATGPSQAYGVSVKSFEWRPATLFFPGRPGDVH